MKVLVGIKRVVDYAVKVRVNKGTVDLSSVKQSMNPFCEVSSCVIDGERCISKQDSMYAHKQSSKYRVLLDTFFHIHNDRFH